MNSVQTRNQAIDLTIISFYMFASLFSAFASYRMHVEPIQEFALPILEAITNFEGRAPDQYRVIPYMIIGAIQDIFAWVFGDPSYSAKYPIIFFDAFFLFASTLLLHRKFPIMNQQLILLVFLLVYPFAMFDGYRPISSYILFLSTVNVLLIFDNALPHRKMMLFFWIGLFSFSRADVALLMAIIAVINLNDRINFIEKLLLVSIPLVVQYVLQFVVFKEAVYFSPVIMVSDNASLRFIMNSPLTFLLLALVIQNCRKMQSFFSYLLKSQRYVLFVMLAYVLVLFVIARPNEYRLLIPYFPILLFLNREFNDSRENLEYENQKE